MRLERFAFRAMGSPCEIKLWGPSRAALEPAARACMGDVRRLEAKFSRYRDDSLATRINAAAGDPKGVEVDTETAALLDFADTAWRESEGRFDPTSGVLRRVWDFKSGRRPEPAALEATRALVGWDKVRWSDGRIALTRAGMELDFGGFVKEYAADRAAEICRSHGLRAGIVDLGGDLAAVGPNPDGSPWRVGIRHPRAPETAIARIALSEGGLATSGDYERFMIIDGVRLSHLLDPADRGPPDRRPRLRVGARPPLPHRRRELDDRHAPRRKRSRRLPREPRPAPSHGRWRWGGLRHDPPDRGCAADGPRGRGALPGRDRAAQERDGRRVSSGVQPPCSSRRATSAASVSVG